MKLLLSVCCLLFCAGCSSTQTAQAPTSRAEEQTRAAIERRAMELSGQGYSYRDALARAESEHSGSLAPLRRAESGRRVFGGTAVN